MTGPATFSCAGLDWQIEPLDLEEQFEVECILLRVLGPSFAAGVSSLMQGIAPALVDVLKETALGGGERVTDFRTEEGAKASRKSVVEHHDDGWAIVHPNGTVLALEDDEHEIRGLHRKLTTGRVERRGSKWLVLTSATEDDFDLKHLLKIDTSDPRLRSAWDGLLEALGETGGEVIRSVVFELARRLEFTEVMRLFSLVLLNGKTLVSDPEGAILSKKGVPYDLQDFGMLTAVFRRDPSAKWELLTKGILVTYAQRRDEEDHEVVEEEDA